VITKARGRSVPIIEVLAERARRVVTRTFVSGKAEGGSVRLAGQYLANKAIQKGTELAASQAVGAASFGQIAGLVVAGAAYDVNNMVRLQNPKDSYARMLAEKSINWESGYKVSKMRPSFFATLPVDRNGYVVSGYCRITPGWAIEAKPMMCKKSRKERRDLDSIGQKFNTFRRLPDNLDSLPRCADLKKSTGADWAIDRWYTGVRFGVVNR